MFEVIWLVGIVPIFCVLMLSIKIYWKIINHDVDREGNVGLTMVLTAISMLWPFLFPVVIIGLLAWTGNIYISKLVDKIFSFLNKKDQNFYFRFGSLGNSLND